MSSTSSAGLAASPSGLSGQECEPSRSVRSTPSVGACSQNTGLTCHATPTFERSPIAPSLSLVSAAASPVSPSALHREGDEPPPTSGPKWNALSSASGQPGSSGRTFKKRQSPTRLNVSEALATQRTTAVYRELTLGRTISETVGGLLHTPTRKANFVAPSMQKWPSCRRFVLAFGGREITPEQFEFLMGLPIGWTELGLSETPSYRKSRKRSGEQS